MFILLPQERTGLAQLEKLLEAVNFKNITNQMQVETVHVLLPRFEVEFNTKLNGPLQKLGMVKMFTDSAEFGDLLEVDEPLKVSDVVHKAVFEINEDGAEAAAATYLQFSTRSQVEQPIFTPNKFDADNPFLYFLRRDETILFMGRFVK
jgi:serpin B